MLLGEKSPLVADVTFSYRLVLSRGYLHYLPLCCMFLVHSLLHFPRWLFPTFLSSTLPPPSLLFTNNIVSYFAKKVDAMKRELWQALTPTHVHVPMSVPIHFPLAPWLNAGVPVNFSILDPFLPIRDIVPVVLLSLHFINFLNYFFLSYWSFLFACKYTFIFLSYKKIPFIDTIFLCR